MLTTEVLILLLFLLPPSCMVAPIGETANKFNFSTSFSSTIQSNNQQTLLPSVNTFSNTEMDHSTGTNTVITNDVRGRSPHSHKNQSRDSSMSSMVSSTIYHERMELNNSMDIDSDPPVETPALSYEDKRDKAIRLSKAAETTNNTRLQNGNNEASNTMTNQGNHVPAGNSQAQPPRVDNNDVINIQLPYDPNAPTEPDLWSGSFHPVSLHSSIEHFASDSKNIKASLNFMAKYIQGKHINNDKANNLSDFNGMGDAIWNFISSAYEAKWDALHTDQNTNTLRSKISAKFTPRIPLANSNTKKDISKSNPVTINKAPPLPPLLAKTKKEINVISKYFHTKKPSGKNNGQTSKDQSGKLYAQASKPSASTSDVLKIKEAFPALNAHKIDQVNSIVNSQNKQKPRINTTTKGLSRKHIIIPMSGNNVSLFLKNSSLNMANINRQLCNAKSDILVDYI